MTGPFKEAVRSLSRSPGFTTAATLSVAGGIGVACSVFAVAYGAFLTPPPYSEPETLLELWQSPGPGSSVVQDYLQPARLEEWAGAKDLRYLSAIAGTGAGPTLVMEGPDGAIRY